MIRAGKNLKQILRQCKIAIENSNYDSMSSVFETKKKDSLVGRHFLFYTFGNYANVLKILKIPFCQLKGKFCPGADEVSLKKMRVYSKIYGELRVRKVTRRLGSAFCHLNKRLKYDNNVLILYSDLQTYTSTRLEIQEFKKVVSMMEGSRARSKQKNIKHDLSIFDVYKKYNFKLPQRCPILGIKLDYYRRRFGVDSPSLDRLDSSKGYTPNNVRIISHQANSWRSNMTKKQKLLIFKDSLAADEEVIIRKKRV